MSKDFDTPLFDTVLVANRGEITLRVFRTLRRLGIRCAAIFTDADANAPHVRAADVARRVPSYLNIDAVVAAALDLGAGAVHPGYGFLAENASFAAAVTEAGIVFVGPPVEAIDAMGDKIRAKQRVEAAGVPVVPGRHEPGLTDDDLIAAASTIGFPVLLKPSAGGGGKGMHRVEADAGENGLREAIAGARREARGAFGDDTLLIERYLTFPRHIEIQVLADAHGGVIHLGERECSLQRRHQKIVEEAPSPLLTPEQRERMGAAAVQAARSCGYTGAGTVEFIVDGRAPDDFFFMEMNTRLQVEHPVTEAVTGMDLVEEQLRVAAGLPLSKTQADVVLSGHAVEARVYAEDPARGFLPAAGRVLGLQWPDGEGVRIDSGIEEGIDVGTSYDPMLAKVIACGPSRAVALQRLRAALADTHVLGLATNTAFVRRLLADDDVAAGRLDTGLVERKAEALSAPAAGTGAADPGLAVALGRLAERDPGLDADPFAVPSGWRIGGVPSWTHERLQHVGGAGGLGRGVRDVRVSGRAVAAQIEADDQPVISAAATLIGHRLHVRVGDATSTWAYARDGETVWVGRGGQGWALREMPVRAREDEGDAGHGPLLAPMPGTVTAVHVEEGQAVAAGAAVVTVEAMKMEHVVRAAADGVVTHVLVIPGQTVAMEATLAVVEAAVETVETGGGTE